MKQAQRFLVVFHAALLFHLDTFAFSQTLSLSDAISKALKRDPIVLGANAEHAMAAAVVAKSYGQILPTVKVGRSFVQQDVRYHDNGELDQDGLRLRNPGIARRELAQSYLDVSQKFVNPLGIWQDIAIAREQREVMSLRASSSYFETVAKVQVQYFRVLIARRSFEKGELHLQTASKDLDVAKQRFAKGFIQGADLRRSEISLNRVDARMIQLRNQLKVAQQTLGTMINGSQLDAELVLATPLPDIFAFERLTQSELQSALAFASTLEQQIAEREAEIAQHELRGARYSFLPELELGVRFNKTWPRQREYEDPAGPEFRIAAEWEVFSGAKDYFTTQAKIENLSKARQQLVKASDVSHEEQITRLPQLETLKSELKMQRQNLASLKDIVSSSRQKFAAGLMTSREVNQDFRDYLDQEEALLEVMTRTISTIAELAATRQSKDLFTKLIFGTPNSL